MAVGYGSDGTSIATAIGMPVEKAREMVKNLLAGMPGMAAYKKNAIKFLKQNGYLIINEQTGHRIYWPEWSTWKMEEDAMDRSFWEDYKIYHKGTGDDVCKRVKRHMKRSGDWFNKNVLNYPIQGGSAIVLKQAASDFFKWIVDKGYFGKVLFCVFVHDEIDVEAPNNITDEVSSNLQSIMEKAAGRFYKKLVIPADVSKGDHWIH